MCQVHCDCQIPFYMCFCCCLCLFRMFSEFICQHPHTFPFAFTSMGKFSSLFLYRCWGLFCFNNLDRLHLHRVWCICTIITVLRVHPVRIVASRCKVVQIDPALFNMCFGMIFKRVFRLLSNSRNWFR